jgi:SAM-dependent methyltransferase
MPASSYPKLSVAKTVREWWVENAARYGFWPTLKMFVSEMSYFLHDSTPARQRQRYGDIDYDWEHRVDTTSATVGFRDRLIGTFHSLYQATEESSFREMMQALPIDFRQFTFIDLGSGKGRTLLMASPYPFQQIIGVELLPALNHIAEENIRAYRSDSQQCFAIRSMCVNARDFAFPNEPIVLYLFNPFPVSTLEHVIANLEKSVRETPRSVFVIYHNPLLEVVLANCPVLTKLSAMRDCVIYEYRPA